ncbi:MAG: hypothetical protein PHE27_01145 [Alphaproteobacteria bacterium]|nr:hypothetical protein [Alphaproteobacteria bacterium]
MQHEVNNHVSIKLGNLRKSASVCAQQIEKQILLSLEAHDLILTLPTPQEKVVAWESIASRVQPPPESDGDPLYAKSFFRMNAINNVMTATKTLSEPSQIVDAFAFLSGERNLDEIADGETHFQELSSVSFNRVFKAIQKLANLDERLDACYGLLAILTTEQIGLAFDTLMNEALEEDDPALKAEHFLRISRSRFANGYHWQDEHPARFFHYKNYCVCPNNKIMNASEEMVSRSSDAFIWAADAIQDQEAKLNLYIAAFDSPGNLPLQECALYSVYQLSEFLPEERRMQAYRAVCDIRDQYPFPILDPEAETLLGKMSSELRAYREKTEPSPHRPGKNDAKGRDGSSDIRFNNG